MTQWNLKDMSDTPRTDREELVHSLSGLVPAEFARTLERELAEALRQHDDAQAAESISDGDLGPVNLTDEQPDKLLRPVQGVSRKLFGWWDGFNEIIHRTLESAKAAQDRGNQLIPLYTDAEAPEVTEATKPENDRNSTP